MMQSHRVSSVIGRLSQCPTPPNPGHDPKYSLRLTSLAASQLVTRSARHTVNSSQVNSSVMFSSHSQLVTMPLYTTVNVTRF